MQAPAVPARWKRITIQSLNPDILLANSFLVLPPLRQAQQKLPGHFAVNPRAATISTTFSSARLTGASLPVEPSFKRTGGQGVVKSVYCKSSSKDGLP